MQRDHRFFEGWARKNRMTPVCKVEEREGDILVADSGEPFLDLDDEGIMRRVYRTAFAIQRGEVWTASYNDYPESDYWGVSRQQGQEMRVNDCLTFARKAIKDCLNVGLYDGRRRIPEVTT